MHYGSGWARNIMPFSFLFFYIFQNTHDIITFKRTDSFLLKLAFLIRIYGVAVPKTYNSKVVFQGEIQFVEKRLKRWEYMCWKLLVISTSHNYVLAFIKKLTENDHTVCYRRSQAGSLEADFKSNFQKSNIFLIFFSREFSCL